MIAQSLELFIQRLARWVSVRSAIQGSLRVTLYFIMKFSGGGAALVLDI